MKDYLGQVIMERYVVAAVCACQSTALAFILSLLSLKINPLHPIASFYDMLSALGSVSTWLICACHMLLTAGSLAIAYKLFDVRRSFNQSSNSLHLFVLVAYNLISDTIATLYLLQMPGLLTLWTADSKESILRNTALSLVLMCVWISAVVSTLTLKYKMDFPKMGDEGWRKILDMFTVSGQSNLFETGNQAAFALRISFIILLFFVTPAKHLLGWTAEDNSFLGSIFQLIRPTVIFACVVNSFRICWSRRCAGEIIAAIVMKPIVFKLPPAYQVMAPPYGDSHGQAQKLSQPYLTAALSSTVFRLKYFAFWDLRRSCFSEPMRRRDIYSLSKPGAHPRNWQTIWTSCQLVLEEFGQKLKDENKFLLASAQGNDITPYAVAENGVTMNNNVEKTNRCRQQAMLLPAHMQHSTLVANGSHLDGIPVTRNWHFDRNGLMGQKSRYSRLAGGFLEHPIVQKLKNNKFLANIFYRSTTRSTPPEAPFADSYVTAWCLESVSQLVYHSLTEDEYGVVQKDLHSVLKSLLTTFVQLERNIRLRQTRSSTGLLNADVRLVEQAFSSGLDWIGANFKSYLLKLDLPAEETALLRSCLKE